MKILDGIRILDLTNVLSGPFASVLLSLNGADVIKIENPIGGDLSRKLGIVPEYNKKLMGTSFLAQNANKKSVTLNLKSAEGKEIFKRLVETADIVVENFRPGVMKRLGLCYEELVPIKPDLIYCAISGFGQDGPDAFKPAYDQIIQGLSGLMAINGTEELNPLRSGFPVCDTVGGLNAAFAIMGALFHRERTGEGQFIDVALLDSIMPLLGWVAANWLIGDQPPVLMGNKNFTAAPSGAFATKDGYINISANKQEQWEMLADTLDLSALKSDPRFQERDARKQNRNQLSPLIEEKLLQKSTTEWVDILNENSIPAGAILSLQEALVQEQIKHRQALTTVNEPDIGDIQLFNLAAKYSKTPGEITSPPPKHSQHTLEILEQLGLSTEEIKDLQDKKVIA
jgi:CoA:oxalate CoA-transferase